MFLNIRQLRFARKFGLFILQMPESNKMMARHSKGLANSQMASFQLRKITASMQPQALWKVMKGDGKNPSIIYYLYHHSTNKPQGAKIIPGKGATWKET